MSEILITSLIVLFALLTSAIFVLWKDYKYYSRTYNAIVSGRYVFHYEINGLVYYKDTESKNNDIIFFDCGSIRLINYRHYLHNSIVTFFSPYSTYWYLKFKKLKKRLRKERLFEEKNKENEKIH